MLPRSFRYVRLIKSANNQLSNFSIYNNGSIYKKFNRFVNLCVNDDSHNNKLRKHFCTKNIDLDAEVEHELDLEISEEPIVEGLYDFINYTAPKNVMYPVSVDLVINELNQCTDLKQVFAVTDRLGECMKHQHCIQTILIVWELLKHTEQAYTLTLKNNDSFERVIEKNVKMLDQMTPEEITCTLLYLNKIGLPIMDDRIQKIIQHCLALINDNGTKFSLASLSRFTVALSAAQGDLYQYIVCKDIMPFVLDYLENCTSSEDLRLITICLNYLHRIIGSDILLLYEKKVRELLKMGVINSDTVRCILRIVNFLNHPQRSQEHSELIRTLSLILKANIKKFQTKELVSLFKVFQSHLEPASLIPEITQQSQHLLNESPSADLLACAVLYSMPAKRLKLTEIAQEIVYSVDINPETLPALFKALRLLKISNLNLINTYWNKVVTEIEKNPEEQESFRIARQSHRYMHFNNNLGGTFRHSEFEKMITKFAMAELETGISKHVPTKFAKFASFIIAYGANESGGTNKLTYPEFIVTKLEEMSGQFSITDCLQISRGLQIALEMRFRKFLPSDVAIQVARIENLLNSCANRHINQTDLSLFELNSIVRTFNNRKTSRKTFLFDKIIGKYENMTDPLNSRLIRDITFNLNASGHRIGSICERMLDYIYVNREFVIGDTVEKVIYSCYNLGYIPLNENVLKTSAEIIDREFEYMSGLSIVQACLALSYFKVLPVSLINRVFNIDFIQRLEDEIKICYSKATYPERVLNQVMQLNRSVCLDYPEAQVPWFQQNYIEAQLTKQPKIETQFQNEVKKMLIALVPDPENVQTNLVTPYGYRIDFVLYMDGEKNFILPPTDDTQHTSLINILRIAILLPKYESFCENNINFMRGTENLKERHLEMLGYKVVHVNYNEWNSMYMGVPNAKLNYIKNLLRLE